MIDNPINFFITIFLFSIIVACSTTFEQWQSVKEGHMCGGIAAVSCKEGLRCIMEGTHPDASGICVKDSLVEKGRLCVKAGSKWLAQYRECEYVSRNFCRKVLQGTMNECASACRHTLGENVICTMQCVSVCKV